MQGSILRPPTYAEITGPLIFLAGPIQCAPDWQSEAIWRLQSAAPRLHIASPRRLEWNERDDYNEQVDWETHHLRRAAREGVILFWLAREAEHRCDRAYAQTTRFELAEWQVRHQRDGVRMVVGIQEGFTGAKYIRRRLGQDCPGIPILQNLDETCSAAVAFFG